MAILGIIFTQLGAAAPAAATQAYVVGPTISTTTGRANYSMAGAYKLAASSQTISTPTITLDGATGDIIASSATFNTDVRIQDILTLGFPGNNDTEPEVDIFVNTNSELQLTENNYQPFPNTFYGTSIGSYNADQSGDLVSFVLAASSMAFIAHQQNISLYGGGQGVSELSINQDQSVDIGTGTANIAKFWYGNLSLPRKLGIGLSSYFPQSALDVNGTADFGSTAKSTFTTGGSLNLATAAQLLTNTISGNDGTFLAIHGGVTNSGVDMEGSAGGTGGVTVSATNGFTGVNKTNPQAGLHISSVNVVIDGAAAFVGGAPTALLTVNASPAVSSNTYVVTVSSADQTNTFGVTAGGYIGMKMISAVNLRAMAPITMGFSASQQICAACADFDVYCATGTGTKGQWRGLRSGVGP